MPVDPNIPPPTSPEDRLADRLARIERELRTLTALVNGGASSQLPVVSALPAAGREGRLVKLQAGGVYIDTGSSWAVL